MGRNGQRWWRPPGSQNQLVIKGNKQVILKPVDKLRVGNVSAWGGPGQLILGEECLCGEGETLRKSGTKTKMQETDPWTGICCSSTMTCPLRAQQSEKRPSHVLRGKSNLNKGQIAAKDETPHTNNNDDDEWTWVYWLRTPVVRRENDESGNGRSTASNAVVKSHPSDNNAFWDGIRKKRTKTHKKKKSKYITGRTKWWDKHGMKQTYLTERTMRTFFDKRIKKTQMEENWNLEDGSQTTEQPDVI